MKELKEEIEQHFSTFTNAWQTERANVVTEFKKHEAVFLKSYTRLVSINLWREQLLRTVLTPGSLGFFLEAQNDALVSHVLASQGAWRASLQSLRAFWESALFCLYFKDHPVELELWSSGKYKPGFAETKEYLSRHPRFSGVELALTGLEVLGAEYSTLSRAVHGGASFRMTLAGDVTLLWSSERAQLGAWSTRESAAISSMNLVLLTMFHKELQGAALPLLRKGISLAIPTTRHALIKKTFGVSLYKL
jgi:hypothetical protein